MLRDRPVPSVLARVVAYGGALAFVASLILFTVLYFTSAQFGDPVGPWSVADGWRPAGVDIVVFTAFALHHSVFARGPLKGLMSRLVSEPLERSTYVWIASAGFAIVCLVWQPVPGVAWTATGTLAAALTVLQLAGIVLSVVAAARIGGLSLAGIPQALGERSETPPNLTESGLYRFVRHPIYLGWLFIVWPTPVMTGTRLVFAAISTAYLAAAIPFEERDLHRMFGPAYADYARRVRWRMLPGVY